MAEGIGGLRDWLGWAEGGGQLEEAAGEVGAGEAPVEWGGGVVVPRLEGEQAPLDGGEVGEVVGREHLALHDGEEELDLIEPGGVGGQMDQDEVGVARLEPPGGCLASVAAAVRRIVVVGPAIPQRQRRVPEGAMERRP